MLKAIDWNDKELAMKALRDYYPKTPQWNLEIAYQLYLQSLEEGKVKEHVDTLKELPRSELAPNPSLKDFDGYEYKTDENVRVYSEEESKAMDWYCKACHAYQPIDQPEACNFKRHKDGEVCETCHPDYVPPVKDEEPAENKIVG